MHTSVRRIVQNRSIVASHAHSFRRACRERRQLQQRVGVGQSSLVGARLSVTLASVLPWRAAVVDFVAPKLAASPRRLSTCRTRACRCQVGPWRGDACALCGCALGCCKTAPSAEATPASGSEVLEPRQLSLRCAARSSTKNSSQTVDASCRPRMNQRQGCDFDEWPRRAPPRAGRAAIGIASEECTVDGARVHATRGTRPRGVPV